MRDPVSILPTLCTKKRLLLLVEIITQRQFLRRCCQDQKGSKASQNLARLLPHRTIKQMSDSVPTWSCYWGSLLLHGPCLSLVQSPAIPLMVGHNLINPFSAELAKASVCYLYPKRCDYSRSDNPIQLRGLCLQDSTREDVNTTHIHMCTRVSKHTQRQLRSGTMAQHHPSVCHRDSHHCISRA